MSRTVRTSVGVLLSLVLLGWAVRDVSLSEVLARIRGADPVLFTLSIIVTLGGFYFRALRWGILLTPIERDVPYRPRIAATYIGFAANNVLPARVGEFARALSLARLTRVRAAPAFATLVIERLLDGLVLVGLLFAAMAAPGFPAAGEIGGIDLQTGALSIALIFAALAVALFLAVASRRKAGKIVYLAARLIPRRFRQPFIDAMRSFASGLEILRSPGLFLVSIVLAVGQWLFLASSYFLGFRAFGMEQVPISGAIFLQSMISLAVAIPSSPGFFGPFEAATRVGLGLWEVPADQAISFAIGYHIAGFIPVTLIGIYYLWRMNLSWSDVRESEESVEEQIHDGGEAAVTRNSGV